MKALLYLFILTYPLGLFAQAPPCVTCFGQTPGTVTITDPARYNEMVPCQGTAIPTYQQFYQRNRFKWYENSPGGTWEFKIKRDQTTSGGNYVVRPVTSPFVEAASSGTTPYLRNLLREDLEPDNLPADGWELIRQDFGFANYNNTGEADGTDNLTSLDEENDSEIKACSSSVRRVAKRSLDRRDIKDLRHGSTADIIFTPHLSLKP